MTRIGKVTLKRELVRAPTIIKFVIEDGEPKTAYFKFAYWSFDRSSSQVYASFRRSE